jgi:Fur family transcriptional regulator, ferric uptake regulator
MPGQRVDTILDRLRGEGIRVTTARRAILTVLTEHAGPISVDDLASAVQSRAPDVHRATVYRNLSDLEDLGLVLHAHTGHGPVMYQLASGARSQLICESCGTTIEVGPELFSALARRAREQYGFVVHPHHFAVLGRCVRCS